MNFSYLVATAYAQTDAAAPKGPSQLESFLPIVVMLVVVFFFMIRPQQKKLKEHSDLLANLKVGDEVVTTGGIIGKVRSINETFVTLEVANNTSIKVLKPNVTSLTKGPAGSPAEARTPAKT